METGRRDSPAVVVAAQAALSVGVLEGVVRVLEGLIPEEAWLPGPQAGLVLEAPVVLSVGGVTLWREKSDGGLEVRPDGLKRARVKVSGFIENLDSVKDPRADLNVLMCLEPSLDRTVGFFARAQFMSEPAARAEARSITALF